MGKFVQPKVYLVGETVLNRDALESFLDDSGNNDFLKDMEGAVAAGLGGRDIMCSAFAKLCYASLSLGKNENVTRTRSIEDNIKAVIKSGHGSILEHIQFNFIIDNCSRVLCYHPDTEIFTADKGWVPIATVTTDDRLLTMDPETKVASFNHPESVHSFDFNGQLFGWSTSQMVSPLVTPDHLLWAAQHDLRRARGLSNEENVSQYASKLPASELTGKRFAIQHSVSAQSTYDEPVTKIGGYEYDSADLAEWLGWLATDGTFSKERSNESRIMQSKPDNVKRIRDLMAALFADRWREHGPYSEDGSIYFVISDSVLTAWAKRLIGQSKLDRDINHTVFQWSKRLIGRFLSGVIGGDGNVHQENGHEVVYCPSRLASGQYQVLFAMVGKSANVRVDDRRGQSHDICGVKCDTKQLSYIVSVSRKGASLVKQTHQASVPYSGKVFCPKTKHGLVYVRRQGLAFWCGNTHELCRHRVGTAFSQTSGRYCRLDAIDLVFDPILEPVRSDIEQLVSHVEEMYAHMSHKLGLVTEANFDVKKKLTSALRRIAPNGQSNQMAFSANLRTLRHTIMLRTARHAEWEIRNVFAQIYRLVKEKAPLFFYDAKEAVVDGELEITGMKIQPFEAESIVTTTN